MTGSLLRCLIRETRIHLYALRYTVAFPGKLLTSADSTGFARARERSGARVVGVETRESFNLGPTAAAARLVTLYGEYPRSRLESLILRSN